ncbi:hypothetical protein BJX61DRAFT_506602 [Aspergillus egyptiacus]|nr:hypothetical protein BJX61DRAFT_506602 [Aspergillus egyptiacus]
MHQVIIIIIIIIVQFQISGPISVPSQPTFTPFLGKSRVRLSFGVVTSGIHYYYYYTTTRLSTIVVVPRSRISSLSTWHGSLPGNRRPNVSSGIIPPGIQSSRYTTSIITMIEDYLSYYYIIISLEPDKER